MTPKIEMLVSLLKAQADRDSVWCQVCAYNGSRRLAVAQMLISGNGIESTWPLCGDHHRARMAKPLQHDIGSEPVRQPEWVSLARQLLAELTVSPDPAKQHVASSPLEAIAWDHARMSR